MTKIPWLQVSIPKIEQSDSGMSHLFKFQNLNIKNIQLLHIKYVCIALNYPAFDIKLDLVHTLSNFSNNIGPKLNFLDIV